MNSSPRVEASDNAQRANVAPFQVRGRFFTAIVLQMARAPDTAFFDAIDTMLSQTPHFYANAPFVLDLDQAEDIGPSFDFIGLAREMRNRKVTLIGVQNGTIEQNKAALHAGLITLPSGTDVLPDSRRHNAVPTGDDKSKPVRPTNENKNQGESAPIESRIRSAPSAYSSGTALLVTEPVRSGQQVFAERGDLVVVASVSPGAELIARGNIHVYGALRGRALAGVHGDNAARIFCEALDAELIAIAGLYKLSDAIDPSLRRQRVQVYLDDGTLHVEPLK
ncbi:MAG TPA: septum site-determining protein MinC [Stellaceae bacterium]